MYKCKKCTFETNNVSAIANHYQFQHRKPQEKCNCEKCGKTFKNAKGLKCHTKEACAKQLNKNSITHICPKCGLYISNHINIHVSNCDGSGTRRKKPKVGRGQNWAKGKTYVELYGIEKAQIIRERISIKLKGHPDYTSKNAAITKSKKLSEIAKNNNYGGYKIGSGRGKHGWYKGYWCDSSWELAFVIYNIEHKIKFKRNTQKFYYFHNGKKHYWIPDFIINGVYQEIKGYLTDLDKSKFQYFTKPLVVLRENDIRYMIKYATNKYGRNYISLYEKK